MEPFSGDGNGWGKAHRIPNGTSSGSRDSRAHYDIRLARTSSVWV
jgi:hypothetical protein